MQIFKRSVAMPHARAAASLDPSAKTRRPKTVRRKTTAARMAKAIAIQTPGATSSHSDLGTVSNRSLAQVSGGFTVCEPEIPLATPRATPSIPRVAINGTTRSRVIARPLLRPTTPPTKMPAPIATVVDSPALMPSAAITPVRAIDEPTERSIPPLIIIFVIPIAPIATITVCARTVRRFFGDRYRAGSPMRIAKVAMTNASPSSGPRRFSHVRARFELEIAGLEFISAIILRAIESEPGAVATGSETQLECPIPSLPLGVSETKSLQILIQWRVQQSLGFVGVQIVERNHGNAGVDPLIDRLPLQMLDHRAHAKITHVEWILHHDSMQLFCAHCVNERLAGVKTNKDYFARLADVLQRQQHARSRRFVGRKNSLYLVAKTIQQILRGAFGGVARGAAVLISRD